MDGKAVRALVLTLIVGIVSLATPWPIYGQYVGRYPVDQLGMAQAIGYVKTEKVVVPLTYGDAMGVKARKAPFRWMAERHGERYLVSFTLEMNSYVKVAGWWWEVDPSKKQVKLINEDEALAQKYDLAKFTTTDAGNTVLAKREDFDGAALLKGEEADKLINLVKQERAKISLTYGELMSLKARGIKQLRERVRVLYNCSQGCPDLVAELEGLVKQFDHVILGPDLRIGKRVALVASHNEAELFDEFDQRRIVQFLKAHTDPWRSEMRGDGYLISFTYESEPGLATGWWWERDPLRGQIRLVNGNEALAKKYDLIPAGTSPDGDELLGRWEVAKGTYVPPVYGRHTLLGAPIVPPYNSDPPTSGVHTFNPAKWGIHEKPIEKEVQVRSLEAGGVLVQYNCPEGCSELVAKLEGVVKRFEGKKVILAPYPGMDQRIALTAWQRLDKLSEFDEERIVTFINAYLSFDRHDIK